MRFVGLLQWLKLRSRRFPRSIPVWRQPGRRFQLFLSKRVFTIDRLPPADSFFVVKKTYFD